MRYLKSVLACAVLLATFPAEVRAQEHIVPVAEQTPALTLADLCCHSPVFCPGENHITVIHPYTCCPVDVCFCLPCGCSKPICKDGLCSKKLVFKYKGLFNDVVIKFKKNGDVVVND